MVLFHLCYDINLYQNLNWYNNILINKIWELSIAISFFLISGISSNFSSWNKNIKRGILISILGFVISLITYIFVKDQFIIFGVLNGLGLCMIITGLIQKYINIDKNLNLYNKNLFILGFPSKSFHSADYFPLIPRIFIYIGGYLIGKILIEKKFYNHYGKNNMLAKIGQNSLKIYLAHQIIIYGIVYFIFTIII